MLGNHLQSQAAESVKEAGMEHQHETFDENVKIDHTIQGKILNWEFKNLCT